MHDLVIRNALVLDGSGAPGFRGELAVDRGRITACTGRVTEPGRHEIDAGGKALAPGFIDAHTHFDVQLCWDRLAQPMLEHGVTTIVTGNCSLTLAPLREEHRGRLCRMFQQIEDLPMSAFEEGIDWTWESFNDYLTAMRRNLGINLAPLVGHSLIRLWVMGEDAFERAATPDEVAAMQSLLGECLDAGAVGLSLSYIDTDERGKPVPSRLAEFAEIRALAQTMGEAGHGMLQIVPEFYDADILRTRTDMLAELSLEFGIPTTYSPLFYNDGQAELIESALRSAEQQAARGARVWPQIQTRMNDINFNLNDGCFMLNVMPGWLETLSLSGNQGKIRRFASGEWRERLVEEIESTPIGFGSSALLAERIEACTVLQTALEKNRGLEGRRLSDIAAERGQRAAETMMDIAVEENLATWFRNSDIGHSNVEMVGSMLAHPNTIVGSSDAGAHVHHLAPFGDTCVLFSTFVRETGALTLEEAVRKLTYDEARAWGLQNRGLLHPGFAADLVVFDPETIARGEQSLVADMPGNSTRWVRGSHGVDAVVVNGELAWTADDGYTEARAGDVVTLSTLGQH